MSHEHAKRGRIPIADLDVDVVASAEIHQGATQNHIGRIGRKKRSDAGRARRAGGIGEQICVSLNAADLADLDAIQNRYNITRSEAIRVAVRSHLAQVKGT